jgi:hypothetical protein
MELTETEKVLTYQMDNSAISFVSDDVRHQVMSYFVLNCLNTDEDYENYIRLSSVDSLLEYIHTWWYTRHEGERCLYLPDGLEETFVRRLGIDAVRHVMVEDQNDSGKQYRNKVRAARKLLNFVSSAKRSIEFVEIFVWCLFCLNQTYHRTNINQNIFCNHMFTFLIMLMCMKMTFSSKFISMLWFCYRIVIVFFWLFD